jgi:hypothetical protein
MNYYLFGFSALLLTFLFLVESNNGKKNSLITNSLSQQPPWSLSHCKSTMTSLYEQKPAIQWPPPCPLSEVSESLRNMYQQHGLPNRDTRCFAQRYEGTHILNWSTSYIDSYCADISSGGTGTYNREAVEGLQNALQSLQLDPKTGISGIKSATALVMGTEYPWVECLLLNEGVELVWTFEYSTINVQHPRMRAKQCQLIAEDYLSGQFDPVDVIVSYSSLEHSGLGRYSDALNPDGDKEALAQAWCMLRPGGLLVLGVPMSCATEGELVFNAHRIYGFERLAYISENYELVGFASDSCIAFKNAKRDPFLILRKTFSFPSKTKDLVADDFAQAIRFSQL